MIITLFELKDKELCLLEVEEFNIESNELVVYLHKAQNIKLKKNYHTEIKFVIKKFRYKKEFKKIKQNFTWEIKATAVILLALVTFVIYEKLFSK